MKIDKELPGSKIWKEMIEKLLLLNLRKTEVIGYYHHFKISSLSNNSTAVFLEKIQLDLVQCGKRLS